MRCIVNSGYPVALSNVRPYVTKLTWKQRLCLLCCIVKARTKTFIAWTSSTIRGKTRRIGNSCTCRGAKYWKRLTLAVASVPRQRAFKRQRDSNVYP